MEIFNPKANYVLQKEAFEVCRSTVQNSKWRNIMNRFPSSKIRPHGPLICDIQGNFTIHRGKKFQRIYIFKFSNRSHGLKSAKNLLCYYWIYNKEGVLGKKEHSVLYGELLVLLRYDKFLEMEEKKEEELKKKRKALKKKNAKKKVKKIKDKKGEKDA